MEDDLELGMFANLQWMSFTYERFRDEERFIPSQKKPIK
jgi:hypothetical protein